MLIVELLSWCRRITEAFQKQAGKDWVSVDQRFKVKEEVDEFVTAIEALEEADLSKMDSVSYLALWDKASEEGIDLIMSTITAFHVLGYTDEEIWDALRRVMGKLENRFKSGYYVKGKHVNHWDLWNP